MKKLLSILMLVFLSSSLYAQSEETPLHLQSVDGIVNEILNVISVKKGEKKDMNQLRNLFLPSARLSILNHPEDSMNSAYESVSLDEFIELMSDEYYQNGFTEYELGKVVNEYNGIANVFQSFHAIDSEGEEGKGVTSYQLVFFNDRWWIANLLWTTDSNGVAIPKKYIDSKD